MFSKMTQALILSGCLVAAGAASAGERNMIVPVIAGAAVGAVVATALSGGGHEHYYRPHYQAAYPVYPAYQRVAYVPAGPPVVYRRYGPPPYYGHGHGYYDHGYNRGYGRW